MNRPAVQTPAPRRILYVENGIGYGGAIICLRHLVRNLDRDRFEPMVVTGRTGPHYREIAGEAPWRHIPDRRIDTVGLKRRLTAIAWIDRVPGLRLVLNQLLARADDLTNFLPFFLQFFILTARFRPAILHANNEPVCNRAAILAGRLLRVPIVCHVRGEKPGTALGRWLYRQVDHFIPVSHWISQGIGELGIPEHRRTVVYDGIALDRLDLSADGMAFRAVHGVPADAYAVGLVGLLIPWKGQDLFIDAAKVLAREIPKLRMLIVGGTPDECRGYERHLRRRVRDEGLEEVVSFTGHVSNMCMVYKGLDVVVSASTSPEPLGTVVIECMAMGRPLVAPNHGGGAEMTDHGGTALLFEPGNSAAFADTVRRLYSDPELGPRLGTNARRKALATFAVEEHVRGVQAVYDRLLRTASVPTHAQL